MFKELTQIILAIHLSALKLPSVLAENYAKTIQSESIKNDIDPLIIIAIVEHESQFNEQAISTDKKDFGLMQIRGQYYYNGQHNDDLLIGFRNIQIGAYAIKISKDYCRKKLDREPTTQEWLSVYQGSPSGYKCKPTKLTKQVEDFALCLKDNVENDAGRDCKEIYWPWMKKVKIK